MTPEMVELGRRAVACKGWRWMSGMRWCMDDDHGRIDEGRPTHAIPDLTDPATLGCMLALIRELLEEPTGYMSWYEGDSENSAGWSYVSPDHSTYDAVPTEAEALIVALEDIVLEVDDD